MLERTSSAAELNCRIFPLSFATTLALENRSTEISMAGASEYVYHTSEVGNVGAVLQQRHLQRECIEIDDRMRTRQQD